MVGDGTQLCCAIIFYPLQTVRWKEREMKWHFLKRMKMDPNGLLDGYWALFLNLENFPSGEA